jgi:hypothetical protein
MKPKAALAYALAWVVYFVFPMSIGLLDVNKIDCDFCLRETFLYGLACFGYGMAGTFLVAIARPSNLRYETIIIGFWLAALFASIGFLLVYRPLWLP